MRKLSLAFLSVSIVVAFITGCSVFKNKSSIKIYHLTVTNPTNVERADELIVLTRQMIEQKLGKIEANFISITSPENRPVIVQFDDLNADGNWDEAVFLYNFAPSQTVRLSITKTDRLLNKAVVRAHVRMRRKNAANGFGPTLDTASITGGTLPTDFTKQKLPPFLTEGPAWENDKVAFRLYLDARNTKDIYGKTTSKMMMDTVGTNPANSYHNIADWGMDILAVGKSLGAGALAMSVPLSNGRDSLVRLGGNNIERISFEIVADGPVRAMFRMRYKNWLLKNDVAPVNLVEEISIWGGKYYYQSRVSVGNAPTNAKLVTGIVNLKTKKRSEINNENYKVVYTYDGQSENKDQLGLAIIVTTENFISFGAAPTSKSDVLDTYTVLMPVKPNATEFRFVAGWERSDLLFTREENFRRYLENEALKYSKKVLVSW